MSKRRKRPQQFALEIPPQLLQRARQHAKRQDRSLASFVRVAIEEACAKAEKDGEPHGCASAA